MEEKYENSNNLNIDESPAFLAKSHHVSVNSENLDPSMESFKKHDAQIVELENQLRKVETDLLVSRENIAFFEEKIKAKEDILHALRVTLDLYKNSDQPSAKESKAEISKQEAIIKIQEEKLARLEAEKKFSNGIKPLSQQENTAKQLKQDIADLQLNGESDIKSSSDMLRDKVPLEYKEHISIQAALIRDLAEKMAKLELEEKSRKALITAQQLLENVVLQSINNQNSDSKTIIEGLHLEVQSYQAKLKMKERDDLLKELESRMAKLN